MTYKINGTNLFLQPTTGKWVNRESLGVSGGGKTVYPGVRKFELQWDLVDESSLNQFQTFYEGVGISGTVAMSLPKYASSTGGFFVYSGCVLHEPEVDTYFEFHTTKVLLLVTNIRI